MSFAAPSKARIAPTLWRWAVYASITGLALELVVLRARGGFVHAWVSEDGPVELLQATLALLAGCLFLCALARGLRGSELPVVLGLACMYAAARELDGFFGAAVGPHGYKLLAAPIAAAAFVFAWRWRFALRVQLSEFISSPSAALVFAGALVILVHAQILGQKELWQAIVPQGDSRTVKKTVEECSELTGYLLIAFAAIELALQRRTRAR